MKQIPADRSIARLRMENPWWRTGRIDGFFDDMTRRAYFSPFYGLVQQGGVRRAVVLMGPRRVGKTVLIHHAIQQLFEEGVSPTRIAYVSVDHPLYNGLTLEELVDLCTRAAGGDVFSYVFFDEIQYLRDWERHLKILVDSNRNTRFTASGSAAAALRLKSLESGAGRFTDFLLPPLTFHEYLLLQGKTDLIELHGEEWAETEDLPAANREFFDYLNVGGYPEAVTSPAIRSDPARFIKSDIIDKVLLRDLPSLYGIHDIQELNSLFTSLAYNTADEVSLEKLSQNSGVAKNTIKRYIEYLEAAFLLQRVTRIDRRARKFRRQTSFKVYLTNPSIRSALFAPVTPDDADAGNLVETAMFSQWFHGESLNIHYARWRDGEIDMVDFVENEPVWVAEVKWSDRVAQRPEESLAPMIAFCHDHDIREAVVTTRTNRSARSVRGVLFEFVPASLYCYTIGRNVSQGRAEELRGLLSRESRGEDRG